MCYYLVLTAVYGSVPCSATKIQRPTVLGWAFSFLLPASYAGIAPVLRNELSIVTIGQCQDALVGGGE